MNPIAGTYHLANNPKQYEPQRTNNFEFVATGLGDLIRAGANGTEANATIQGNAQEFLQMSVAGAFVPHFKQGVIEVKRGNNTVKFAGTPTFDSGRVTVNDFIGSDAKGVLMAWQNLSYNVKTQYVNSIKNTNYKKDCYLMEYSPDYELVRTWLLHGCWISELSEGEYSYDQNNVQKVTATITYDWAEIDNSDLV